MWYLIWILGVLLACSISIFNVLRLENQEKSENDISLDPLTQLLTRESILNQIQEKVDNSKRSGMPFSLLYLSLTDFLSQHRLEEKELNTLLFRVSDSIASNLREHYDSAARVEEGNFIVVMPGTTESRASSIAERIKLHVADNIQVANESPVDMNVGVAEYSKHSKLLSNLTLMGVQDVEALLNIAIGKCFETDSHEI